MSTTSRSKNSSAKSEPAIDRPFDAKILARAKAIADKYQVVLWQEDGEWYGRGVELPTTMNDGKTAERCVANVRDSFVTTVAWMLERGKQPPPAVSERARTMQVNLRVTADEKLSLEAAAKQKGYGGVSDFVRAAALGAANSN